MTPAILLLIGVGPLVWLAALNPKTVTELMGKALTLPVVGVTLVGAVWALVRGTVSTGNPVVHGVAVGLVVLSVVMVVGGWGLWVRRSYGWARVVCGFAVGMVVLAGTHGVHDEVMVGEMKGAEYSKFWLMVVQTGLCVGLVVATGVWLVAAMCVSSGWTRAMGRVGVGVWVAGGLLMAYPVVEVVVQGLGQGWRWWAWVPVFVGPGVLGGVAMVTRRRKAVRAARLLLGAWVLAVVGGAVQMGVLAGKLVPW